MIDTTTEWLTGMGQDSSFFANVEDTPEGTEPMASKPPSDAHTITLRETESKLCQAMRDYIAARTDTGPIDDMVDEAIWGANKVLKESYDLDIEAQ